LLDLSDPDAKMSSMDNIERIRQKGQGTPAGSVLGERLTPRVYIFNFSQQEIITMSLLFNVQTFLTNHSDFPQESFSGEHELNIQRLDPDHDYSQEQIEEIVSAIVGSDESQEIVVAVSALCRDRINVLTGNAARAEKTRAPQVGSTQSKGWKHAIATEDFEAASVMYQAYTSDVYRLAFPDVTDKQIANLKKELDSIRPEGN